MNKELFLLRLRNCLGSLPMEEREAALKYYEEYFSEAGFQNEQAVINELISPEKVAEGILSESNPSYTLHGKELSRNDTVFSEEAPHKSASGERRYVYKYGAPIWAVGLLLLFVVPIVVPLFMGLTGGLVSLLFGAIGLLVAFLLSGVVTFGSGIVTLIYGFWKLFSSPVDGIFKFGEGLALMGVGILLCMLVAYVSNKVFIPLLRWLVNSCKKIFKK